MIKINLLPTKKKPPKRVTELQQQLIVAALILIVLGLGMTFYWMSQNAKIKALEREKAAAEARIQQQNVMLKEVLNVEKDRKMIAEKIGLIEKLKKSQTGPVRILDELAAALPEGVNVTALAESKSGINIDGEAFSNNHVVRFVEQLKASRYLSDVTLLETTQAKRQGIDIYRYKLHFAYKGL